MSGQVASYGFLQGSLTATGPAGATANGNGIPLDTEGYKTVVVEIAETAGGTATVALQGSFDGTNWYAVGYQQVDNTLAPARAVANISLTANSRRVYQIVDLYPQLRAVLSAVATGATVTVRAYQIPV